MDIVRISATLIEIDGRVRIEKGPLLKTAVATEELLASGDLAQHYIAGSFDKLGAVIVIGQEFAYLDWKGEHGWHVYEFCVEEWAGPDPHWRRRNAFETEGEAMVAGGALAQQLAGA